MSMPYYMHVDIFFGQTTYHTQTKARLVLSIQLLEYAKKNSQNLGNNTILSFSQTQFVNMCGLNKSTLLLNTYLHVYYLVVHLSLDLFSHIFTSDTTQSLIQKKYHCFLYLGMYYQAFCDFSIPNYCERDFILAMYLLCILLTFFKNINRMTGFTTFAKKKVFLQQKTNCAQPMVVVVKKCFVDGKMLMT